MRSTATYRVPTPLAAAAVAGAALAAVEVGRALARLSRRHHGPERARTGGCDPDEGPFLDAVLTVHDVDGSHQGVAVALLRQKFTPLNPDLDEEPVDLTYEETLRSCVEVALSLSLEMAEAQVADCECGDPECEATADPEILHLIAARTVTRFATSFEEHAASHARQCRACAREGLEAPMFLRARFCRDIADDLLLNTDSDDVDINGVPVQAAFDVLCTMIEVTEQEVGTSPADQIDGLTTGLVRAIAHAEGHPYMTDDSES